MQNIVIIGAGLGGLTAGALLAKDGYKVTLLEQHSIVGGCASVFKRKGGFTCEVGLHEMDGVYTNPTIKKVFEKLGVYQHVEFIKPDEFFKVYTKKGEFVMPDDVDSAKKALKQKFPDEKRVIDNYFNIILNITECYKKLEAPKWYEYLSFLYVFYPILKYKNRSVSDVLDRLTDNDELKLILNANIQYYNDSMQTLSFLLHSVAQSSYFMGGGHFIKGGSYRLSRYLADTIEKNGGQVITNANVIKATNSSVVYTHKAQNRIIQYDKIISNISPQDSYRLFGVNYDENKEVADSMTTIYLGFSKNLKEIYGKRAYSNFVIDEYSMMNKAFVFVDYSQIDSALTDSSKSFGQICFIDYLKSWDTLNEWAYQDKKERLLENALCQLEKYYPHVRDYIEFAEVATPKTMVRYVKSPNGTAYGYKPTPKQFFRIPKVKSDKVDNLYFVGQFVVAGGFSPAISSGYMCYKEIVKDK